MYRSILLLLLLLGFVVYLQDRSIDAGSDLPIDLSSATAIPREQPGDGVDPVAWELADKGSEALAAGKNDEAVDYFEAAEKLGLKGLSLSFAVAWYNLGDPDQALRYTRIATEEWPEKPSVWTLLGQLLREQGDLNGAADAWEKSLALVPDAALQKNYDLLLADLGTREEYFEGESSHFVVRFQGPAQLDVAHAVLVQLELAYSSVGRSLEYYPDKMIETILYTDTDFYDVTRSPAWTGGVFDGTVRLPVSGAMGSEDELKRVVTHEYVHAVITDLAGRNAPTWLHEGLAKRLEGSGDAWVRKVLPQGSRGVPLSALSGSFLDLSAEDAPKVYAQSYLFVDYLVDHYGMYQMVTLLRWLRSNSFENAFLTVYSYPVGRLFENAMKANGVGV